MNGLAEYPVELIGNWECGGGWRLKDSWRLNGWFGLEESCWNGEENTGTSLERASLIWIIFLKDLSSIIPASDFKPANDVGITVWKSSPSAIPCKEFSNLIPPKLIDLTWVEVGVSVGGADQSEDIVGSKTDNESGVGQLEVVIGVLGVEIARDEGSCKFEKKIT